MNETGEIKGVFMLGKLRNMTSIYLFRRQEVLLLFRQGSIVVNDVWLGTAGGHFEEFELNDAKQCALRELKEEVGLEESQLSNLTLKYVTLRTLKSELLFLCRTGSGYFTGVK